MPASRSRSSAACSPPPRSSCSPPSPASARRRSRRSRPRSSGRSWPPRSRSPRGPAMPAETEARAAAARINQLILELWIETEGQGPQYQHSDFELTGQQHAVLERIANDPEITSARLAADLGVTKGAISQHLGVLEKGGYLTRRRSERDGRVQVLELQPRGVAYRDALRRYEEFTVDRYLAKLSADDIAEIVAALTKLKSAFAKE
ncbi:hypothetical protein CGZ94_02955 [Enemella evansiae]|uniref:HTH marR-type domain-containing protein n=2 Tax=Enemella evansiae TaxID=2016499 RepID=A0A255GWK2_9ACTN|nr:hypothetical protein CGZ97_07845 [Enemella evansiae]OYO17844.1 hypothetical protein CGZ94_02955 [Enemella evansiae]